MTAKPPDSQPASRRRWPVVALAIWSLLQLALAVAWLLGYEGYPFEAATSLDEQISLLAGLSPMAVSTGLAVIAVAGLAAAAAAVGGIERAPLVGVLAVGAIALVLVVPDFRLLAAVAYTPLLAINALFGWPEGATVAAAWPWPMVYQAFALLGGLVWGAAAASIRGPTADSPATVAAATRWGSRAVWVAVAVPLVYATTRYAWALGIPLGITDDTLRRGADSGLWRAGAGLATLAVIGAVLTLGLSQRWGEVVPRWVPWLGGRTIPVAVVTVPALIVGALVTSAGIMFIRLAVTGVADDFQAEVALDGSGWGLLGPELLWPLWGVALAVGAFSYRVRRHRGATATG